MSFYQILTMAFKNPVKFSLLVTVLCLLINPVKTQDKRRPPPGPPPKRGHGDRGHRTYCEDPGNIINGWRTIGRRPPEVRGFGAGHKVSFRCYEPYRMEGDQIMTCVNGRWQPPTPPKCRAAFCPVPSIPHGRVIQKLGGFYKDDTATIMCDPGYHLTKPVAIVCGPDRRWSSILGPKMLPRCIEVPEEDRPCGPPPPLPNGRPDSDTKGPAFKHGDKVMYTCRPGYYNQLGDNSGLQCNQGEWRGPMPRCMRRPPCPDPRNIPYSTHSVGYTTDGTMFVYYACKPGFVIKEKSELVCVNGRWSGRWPTCVSRLSTGARCKNPKQIRNGFFKIQDGYAGVITSGARASYSCDDGYRLREETQSMMECSNGIWRGQQPTCVKRTQCDHPTNKPHAHWIILGAHADFRIGSRVMYECDDEYKAVGTKEIECLPNGFWSSDPPNCEPKGFYCKDPGRLRNGFITCTPKHCDSSDFKVDSHIEYICKAHFEAVGQVSRTCEKGGIWSGTAPICVPLAHGTTPVAPMSVQGSGIPNISTLTIVIATSCSVLGVLLIVMVVVAFQRRKPNTRLCHPVQPPPPPYTRPRTNSVEEHDRLALIAFADGVQVVLPSYDEATRARGATRQLSSSGSSTSRSSRGSGQNEGYRPLPSIPSNLRGRQDSVRSGTQIRELPLSDSHRNSTITVGSTATRDNLSEVFGSIDTMNASMNAMSDGTSTSVTIETYDSTVSNPSIAASQRAHAGSITSFTGSDTNEDAPLIIDQNNSDAISLSESLPVSEETKEE